MTNKSIECIEPGCLSNKVGRSNYCAKHQLKNATQTKRYDDGKKRQEKEVPIIA
jgi:hypothetical protein